jgi:UDP-N-acetylmuramyl pentapeptide phosphotransferase/UDP-N-acetylglucosamine-1-phosphate transferase
MLLASCRSGAMQPWQALLLCTPMLLDSAFTLARRVLRGRRFWRAHREHLYQYAVRKGHSHARVALAYAGATALAWLLALAGQGNHSSIVAVALPALAWLGGAALYFALRQRWLGKPLRTGSQG